MTISGINNHVYIVPVISDTTATHYFVGALAKNACSYQDCQFFCNLLQQNDQFSTFEIKLKLYEDLCLWATNKQFYRAATVPQFYMFETKRGHSDEKQAFTLLHLTFTIFPSCSWHSLFSSLHLAAKLFFKKAAGEHSCLILNRPR